MVKVLLVEDEEIIREGLINEIISSCPGFEIVEACSDGIQALKIAEKERLDIIITDIRMPFLDGLKLIEKVKKIHPQTFFVIISGHDEFKYAQKAINLGVTEYILKPIMLDQLKKILEKIRVNISDRDRKKSETLEMKKKSSITKKLLKEQLLRNIIFKQINIQDIKVKISKEKINRLGDQCAVILIQIDNYIAVTKKIDSEQIKKMNQSLDKKIETILFDYKNIFFFKASKYEYIICIAEYEKKKLKQNIAEIKGEICKWLSTRNDISTTVVIGGLYESIDKLSQSYKDALSELPFKYVLGKDKIIDSNDDREKEIAIINKDEHQLILKTIKAFKHFGKDEVKERIDLIFNNYNLRDERSMLRLLVIVSNIYTEALNFFENNGGNIENVYGDPIERYRDILLQETSEKVGEKLFIFLKKIIDYLQIQKYDRFNNIIQKAKNYINENYYKNSLSLKDVANHINLAVCYFSSIFSKQLGQTYRDYLADLRINKAKEFMEASNFMDYEICLKVGYNNPTYFSTIFKRKTGFTPSEYRNLVRK